MHAQTADIPELHKQVIQFYYYDFFYTKKEMITRPPLSRALKPNFFPSVH